MVGRRAKVEVWLAILRDMVCHMKTTVEIADPLLREAKREAGATGTTLRELIEMGLRRVLEDRSRARSQPVVVADGRVGGDGVQPGIREGDARQLRALANAGRGGIPNGVAAIDEHLRGAWESDPE